MKKNGKNGNFRRLLPVSVKSLLRRGAYLSFVFCVPMHPVCLGGVNWRKPGKNMNFCSIFAKIALSGPMRDKFSHLTLPHNSPLTVKHL